MKKLILIILIIILLIGGVYSGVTFKNGYDLYEETMKNVSIEETFETIQSEDWFVDINEIPNIYLEAVVSVEDKRFYSHNGFDILSFGKAVLRNVIENDYATGGSTITQQLAKNLYFSFDKKMERKVAELIVAKQIESLYEKDDILELYVNIIYFGDSFEGIHDASMGYFNKLPKDLTDGESVLLAGLPQAPSAYALFEHLDRAVQRAEIVLDSMIEKNYISTTQKEVILEEIRNIKIQVN